MERCKSLATSPVSSATLSSAASTKRAIVTTTKKGKTRAVITTPKPKRHKGVAAGGNHNLKKEPLDAEMAELRLVSQKRMLSFGSDCSGLGTDAIALRRLGVACRNVFACDTDPGAQQILKQHKPNAVYSDIYAADRRGAPSVDVYVAGPPCQPYSRAGANKGSKDPRCVFKAVLRYISRCLPTFFVIENVKNLTTTTHKADQ